ncbi:MAG TPA: YfhO family protein [Thermoanaerobaculia bacterium]
MAFTLYLVVTVALVAAWSRLQRLSVAAAIALIALPLLPTGRAILTGRTLAPVDISFVADPLHQYARDYGVETPHNIHLSDLHCQIIPWQKAVRYALANGEWPLWNPFVLAGDILAAAAQPAVYDPWQWVAMLLPLHDAFTFSVALTFFLSGLFAFALARDLGVRDTAALVAATGFLLCGMMAFFAGWPLGRSWAYLPLVLFATRRVVHHEKWGLLTAALALTIVAGHPESVLHVVTCGAAYGLFELARVRRIRPLLLATGAGLLALLLTAVYLLPFAEAVPQTLEHHIREALYAGTPYGDLAPPKVRAERLARTFIPGVRHTDPLTARVGPVVLLLAVAGVVVRRRDRQAWFFAALAVAGTFAAIGLWPVPHLLHALPLFDIAINERLAFAGALAMSLLAAFAVDAIRKQHVATAILGLVLLERTYEDGNVYPAIDRDAFFPRTPLIAAIPRDARMAAWSYLFTGNNPTMYGLEDVRGYQAMTNRRLTDTYPLWSVYQRAWFNRIDDLSRPFLSFLNVRYAVGKGEPPEGWRVIAEDRGTRLFENTRELPRAFVPRFIHFERDSARVLEAMKEAPEFVNAAWIETDEIAPGYLVNGRGHVLLRRSGLAYELDAAMDQAGWVVVSATHWKGWRAYIDGRRVRTYFANHAFVGVYVPEGQHRVTLKYLPQSFTRGRAVSVVTALALLAVFLVRRCRPFFSTSPRPPR